MNWDCHSDLFLLPFQLEEQLKFIKSNVIHIGVGTANRIQCLLERGECLLYT